ncbi:ATP-grasp domain-containing protein [Candidatus Bathyarchaeota archaeon]|nr:ATP-grasp domain-containing protein [Candidatus Bathyarchaeota archaeon]
MKLFVYEHISGGGFVDKPIPPEILCEGYGMLKTLISDFHSAGHNVVTLLDSRLAVFRPQFKVDCITPVSSFDEFENAFEQNCGSVDAAFVVAPESEQVLKNLVERIEQTGVNSLNCGVKAIEEASNKALIHELLERLGIATPNTVAISKSADLEEQKRVISGRLEYPLILKPLDGVSGCGVSFVRSKNELVDAIDKIVEVSMNEYFIAQQFVRGIAASVNLICTNNRVLPISLNKQNFVLATPDSTSEYNGGIVPLVHPLEREAFEVAEKVVKSVGGLRGYVGVDLVLTEDRPVVLEVNPRFTTSCIGLREVTNLNLAEALIQAAIRNELPENVENSGVAFFSKIGTPRLPTIAHRRISEIKECISPPFPVSADGIDYSLFVSHGATLREAISKFDEAIERLYNCRGDEG